MDSRRQCDTTRRRFLKNACSAGLAAAVGGAGLGRARASQGKGEKTPRQAMPRRPLGKTGIEVPILGLGGSLNLVNQQLLLSQALAMGVTYWDTADNYSGGRSEEGIGAYFARHPADRQRVFLVTKTSASSPEGMGRSLAESLARLKTDYVDLFLLHGISRVEGHVDEAMRRWVAQAKAEGRIRLFGFSTHRNMAACLDQAARMGGFDAVMLTYNYRVMDEPDMQQAVAACADAGVGLVAMKTQGWSFSFGGAEPGEELVQHFMARGLSEHQARLKAVWDNPQIAAVCSHMDTLGILKENVAAALDDTPFSARDRAVLRRHARRTAAYYCTGCGDICEAALTEALPVADVMRCLMYAHGYNDYQMAREAFARLPHGIRDRLRGTDFGAAESRCPRRLAIGGLMRRAADELGTGQPSTA